MNKQMNKWRNEWINEWKKERTCEWMSEWMNKQSVTAIQIILKWDDEWLQFCREFLQVKHYSIGVYGILQ